MARVINLKASSLVEVIIAMVVITLVFGLTLVIYLNVVRSSSLFPKLKASSLLDQVALQTKTEKRFFEETLETGGYHIHKQVSIYRGNERLLLIRLQATDPEGTVLAERNELIPADE